MRCLLWTHPHPLLKAALSNPALRSEIIMKTSLNFAIRQLHGLLIVGLLGSLGACSIADKRQSILAEADAIGKAAKPAMAAAKAAAKRSNSAEEDEQEVTKPWLIGNTLPIDRSVAMPSFMNKNITALYGRAGVNLSEAVRQVMEASGVMIAVTPDALLPASQFGPRLSSTGGATPAIGGMASAPVMPGVVTPGAGSVSSMPASMASQSSVVQGPGLINLSSIAGATPLYKILDEISRQGQVSWQVVGQGVEIYRTRTKIFKLNALAQGASTISTLGRNASNNAVFDSSSKTTYKVDSLDQVAGIVRTIDALLTQGGRSTLSPETQTIVVSDTPDAIARVSAFVDAQNKASSRRIRLLVEAVDIVAKDTGENGLDWGLIYNNIHRATSLTVSAPGSLAGANAGGLGISSTAGMFTGTSTAFKALSEIATVVDRRTYPLVVSNGRPVSQAYRRTFSYVDSVQATTTSSTTAAVAPTVTQKEETVGTFVTMVPNANDNGSILLSVSFDSTGAQPLTPFVVGSANNQVTVQQKDVSGTAVVHEIPMRSGETVVVGGSETVSAQSTQRRITSGASLALGGSDRTALQKQYTVVLVTALTEEGI
jgi:type IVB pilus formation R64 PilN family outer membrane protein